MAQKEKTNPKTHNKIHEHSNKSKWSMKEHDKELGYMKRAVLDKLCQHCYNAITWKLDYGKYKPITVPGKCCKCAQKSIFKSYRTICDKCATDKMVCTKCGKDAKKYADMPEEMKIKLKDDKEGMYNYMKKLRESSRRVVKRLTDDGLVYWNISKKKFLYLEGDAILEGLKKQKKHRDEDDESCEFDEDEMSDDGIDVEEMKTRKLLKNGENKC